MTPSLSILILILIPISFDSHDLTGSRVRDLIDIKIKKPKKSDMARLAPPRPEFLDFTRPLG